MKNSLRKFATGVGVAGLMGALGATGAMEVMGSTLLAQGSQTYQGSSDQQTQPGTSSEQGYSQPQKGSSQPGSTSSSSQPGSSSQQGYSSQQGQPGQQGGMSNQWQQGGKSSRTTQSSRAESMRGERERSGRIRFVDPSNKTLALRGPMRAHEFTWSKDTEVLRNGKSVGPDALRKGDRVHVTYRKEGNQLMASQIVISSERRQARRSRSHSEQQY